MDRLLSQTVRLGLVALALSSALVGIPALLAPHTFFADFPFVGHWVDRLGSYNEHLTTDVGTLYSLVAALFAWAAATGNRALAFPLCVTWTVAGLVHLLFHVTHLEDFPTADAVAQTVALAAVPVLAAVLARASRPLPG